MLSITSHGLFALLAASSSEKSPMLPMSGPAVAHVQPEEVDDDPWLLTVLHDG